MSEQETFTFSPDPRPKQLRTVAEAMTRSVTHGFTLNRTASSMGRSVWTSRLWILRYERTREPDSVEMEKQALQVHMANLKSWYPEDWAKVLNATRPWARKKARSEGLDLTAI